MQPDGQKIGICVGCALLLALALWLADVPHTLALFLLAPGALLAPMLLWWHQRPAPLNLETRETIQRVINAIPQPVYIKAPDAKFLWINEAFARERGLEPEALLKLNSFDISPSAEMSALIAEEDKKVLRGDAIDKEQSAIDPGRDKESIRIVSKRPCHAPNGEHWIVGMHFDITHQRQIEIGLQSTLAREEALHRRVVEYMQRLIDVIPQPVYIKDAQSRFLLVNEAFVTERMLSRAEIIGRSPHDLSKNPEHARNVMAEDLQVLAGRAIFKEEHIKHPVDGEERFRHIHKQTTLNAEDEPVIVGTNFDITPRRVAERDHRAALAKLGEARSLQQALAEAVPAPLCVLDAAHTIQLTNPAFATCCGLPGAALIGQNTTALPEPLQAALQAAAQPLKGLDGYQICILQSP